MGNWVLFWWVGAMLSKFLIQFSVDGWGCIPSLLFDLRPYYGGGNEDNGNFLQKVLCMHCLTHCPRPCSKALLTHASAGNSGSVSCGVAAPFFWVLVYTRFCLCPPAVCFLSPVEVLAGLMATSSKRAYVISRSAASRALTPAAGH